MPPKPARPPQKSKFGREGRSHNQKHNHRGQKTRDTVIRDAIDKDIAANPAGILLAKASKPKTLSTKRQSQLASLATGALPSRARISSSRVSSVLAAFDSLSTKDSHAARTNVPEPEDVLGIE